MRVSRKRGGRKGEREPEREGRGVVLFLSGPPLTETPRSMSRDYAKKNKRLRERDKTELQLLL